MNLGDRDEAVLRALVRGVVMTAGDDEYDDARKVFNGAIDRRPAVIVQVTSPGDVVQILRFSRERGLSISVRGGGHGVAGHAVAGDVVIDLSEYRGVRVDAERRTAVVRGGSRWSEVDLATQAHGLAVPGPRISGTGVGGLTLGGGIGWLSRRYGTTADNLVSVELVTADGSIVEASETTYRELFWAVRGGGGNFGVATSFTFRLHPAPSRVLGGMLLYDLDNATKVFELLAELHSQGYDELAATGIFAVAPPSLVPPDLAGRPVLAVVPAWMDGDPQRGAAVIQPLLQQVRPVADLTAVMPYIGLQTMLDDAAPPYLRHFWAASTLPAVPAALVEAMTTAIRIAPSSLSHIIVAPGANRDASWLVNLVGCWSESTRDALNLAWTRDLATTIRGYGETGTYLNVDQADEARIRWSYGDDRYRRLQRVKAEWDPHDVFRHCDHIPPRWGAELW